jgi:undecaprenyl-diphosphatase
VSPGVDEGDCDVEWFEAIVLGIVQGLTEFLPISSSAHVSIVGQLLFDGRDPGAAFTAVTQLGTETAVLVYFRKDIWRIITSWVGSLRGTVDRSDPDARMGWLVMIGSLPIVVLGLLFQDAIDTWLRNLWITVAMLAGVAIFLAVADRMAGNNTRELRQLTWRDGVLFGLFQAAALIPGVSRSGATISGGLFMGYTREAATRYAFLLAIPAVFGSGLYKLKDIGGDEATAWGPTIVATVLAFFIGYAVIAWLLRYISTHDFRIFVLYRLILAAVVTVLILTGVLSA